ncbi:hypothetical protein QO207_22130 [Pseudomonas sp. CAN2814]|uniref:ORC-CDC6 family AAA ATPase n=1 Tax=Pseudomonas sp. CAN1 TaxID=3046726 RepID=UPI002647601F|nr:hypothetical protein [Pseudomonas sp. CAN1]MDN6859300.1 hypothetical protein [Pseudomonas sp. CAN1]
MRDINTETLKLTKRAENNTINLVSSFVELGPVIPVLSIPESQVIYGRRGTGKTHILRYLDNSIHNRKECSIYLDMRVIGSTGGIYADERLPLKERATRLLSDTLIAIHERILEKITKAEEPYVTAEILPLLDEFVTSATEVIVDGTVATEKTENTSLSESRSLHMGVKSGSQLTLDSKLSLGIDTKNCESKRTSASGSEKLRVHFGSLNSAASKLIAKLPKQRLWIILDEWSEVPLDLQPFLADLLRRTLFPTPGVAIKIAAIAQRSNFRIPDGNSTYIGLEPGADVAGSLNLDEFLVFDNEAPRAMEFFGTMLHRHLKSISDDQDIFSSKYPEPRNLINDLFTQINAFEEFVRASEGVPRDAINILSLAAQRADKSKISVPDVRIAAKNWYSRYKSKAIASRQEAIELLNWIIDEVIQHRQAKAFLVPSDLNNDLIDFLYDARVLHILREGISAQDIPGKRFNVYSIDYGCYVDLINTIKAPKGLFQADDNEKYSEVPQNDYRSIRRAILDIQDFKRRTHSLF